MNYRLRILTTIYKQYRTFPFNSPSYLWEEEPATENAVCFNCVKCPVAEYFESKGLLEFCAATWCALDYPLAEMWNAKLLKSGSIAGEDDKFDFKCIVK